MTRQTRKCMLVLSLLCAGAALAVMPGCNLFGFFAYTIDRAIPKKVEAAYRGLEGRDFAVMAIAPRGVEADFPGLVPKLVMDVSDLLARPEGAGASGYVPGDRVLGYMYANPNWIARPTSEVARDLGVTRLVIVEIGEFRVYDVGNQYIYDGLASAIVQVYEADSALADDAAFDQGLSVRFPDGTGFSADDMPVAAVAGSLAQRLAQRTAWLFFDHEEPKDLPY